MPWVIAGGLALAGYAGYKGSSQATDASVGMSREQMDWQTEEAKKNREYQAWQSLVNRQFQERMSNTAVQRRMEDMKAGGINPLLAGKFEASTTGGSAGAGGTPSGVGMPNVRNNLAEGLTATGSAMSMLKLRTEIANLRETTQLIKDQSYQARGSGTKQYAEMGKVLADRDKQLQNIRKDEFRTQVEEFKSRVGYPILSKEASSANSLDSLSKKTDKVFNNLLDNLMRRW